MDVCTCSSSECLDGMLIIFDTYSDQIAVIPTIDAMIKAVPCTHIIGFVIYDLPGRDCGGEASGGEYQTGELARYKSEYIDGMLFKTSSLQDFC